MNNYDRQSPDKWVTCPHCTKPSRYASSNAYRPFCSQRCQQLDLGAWASQQFAVAEAADTNASLDAPDNLH